jgi:hypothetical protein
VPTVTFLLDGSDTVDPTSRLLDTKNRNGYSRSVWPPALRRADAVAVEQLAIVLDLAHAIDQHGEVSGRDAGM